VAEPRYDVTYLFYECEEVEAARNELTIEARERPEWLVADFAVLLEPTYGAVEAGCQWSMRRRTWPRSSPVHQMTVVERRQRTRNAPL
jgi:succinyl-diaminopimelate desuccinylase